MQSLPAHARLVLLAAGAAPAAAAALQPAAGIWLERASSALPRRGVARCAADWPDLGSPEHLTDAIRARTVLAVASEATLCTQSGDDGAGAGFACPAAFVVGDDGAPIFRIASAHAAASLAESARATFFARAADGGARPRSCVTMLGTVEPVSAAALDECSESTVASIDERLGTRDGLRRLVPARVHYADGLYPVEAWVAPDEFAAASASVLATEVSGMGERLGSAVGHAWARWWYSREIAVGGAGARPSLEDQQQARGRAHSVRRGARRSLRRARVHGALDR